MTTISIGNESIPDPLMAGNGTVGTSEAKLTDPDFIVRKGIVVHADSDNSGNIIVGRPGSAAAGFALAAGQSTPPIQVDNTSKIAIAASEAGQAYSWTGQ
jgi:hypothetical protein